MDKIDLEKNMKYIIGNLKMNLLTPAERERYFESFEKEIKNKKIVDAKIIICPPSIHIEAFAKRIATKTVSIGAQNVFWEERGSYTGEISALMAKNFGAQYLIVGHSERRNYFSENAAQMERKVSLALKCGLRVIYCVGETVVERNSGKMQKIIKQQLQEIFQKVPNSKIENMIVAYEPIWSVGSDKVPASDDVLAAKIVIKKQLVEMFGNGGMEKIPVVYGGSVSSRTVLQVCIEPEMDGVLVGRESLIPYEFLKISENINNAN